MGVNGELPDDWSNLVVGVATAWSVDDTHAPVRFHREEPFADPRWPANVPHPNWTGVWGVGASGLIEVHDGPDGWYLLSPTPNGLERAAELGADVLRLETFPRQLQWLDMARILVALIEAVEDDDAPGGGVRVETLALRLHCRRDDKRLHRAIGLLQEDGYLELGRAHPRYNALVGPAPRALQLLRDWPSREPHIVTARLEQAIDQAIDRTDDPEEKTKLQRLRSTIGDVSKTVVSGLLLEVGKGAI